MRVTVALGTRPEVIKLAPVVAALRAAGATVRVVHTGQHTDANLADDLERECGLTADARWALPTQSEARLAAVFGRALDEFAAQPCDVAVVLGDTWTVPLVGMAARAHRVPVVHAEAGLRSHNLRSQEEVNRRCAVGFTNLHLAPTQWAADTLGREGVSADAIVVTGNPVTDALAATRVERRAPHDRDGVLFTAHRASNVDDPARLLELVEIVAELEATYGRVRFPVHPRTRSRLIEFDLLHRLEGCAELTESLGYRQLLSTLAASTLVVTDSGGLQEEAAWFAVPAVVMRASTPRPEGVAAGFAMLAGVDRARVMAAATALTRPVALEAMASSQCPYGDGHCAPRIADAINAAFAAGRLQLREPELRAAA